MARTLPFVLALLVLAGCTTTQRMGAAELRERGYPLGNITLSPTGLTEAEGRAVGEMLADLFP